MDITSKITIRHMKRNKKRTGASVFTIALSTGLIMMVSIFIFSLFDIMIRTEIRENGAYHARFHSMTKGQMNQLSDNPDVASCETSVEPEEHALHGGVCADVILKKPGADVYTLTQKMAEEIKMKPFPAEEVLRLPDETPCTYDVTYHDELLKFYGAKTEAESQAAVPIATAAGGILLIIILFSCILIHHSFSISAFEKLRYLGMLGSVGATSKQKRKCVLLEGFIVGGLGIPSGLAAGTLVTYVIFRLFSGRLMKLIGSEISMHFVMNPLIIMITVLCGILIIFAASLLPAYRAGKISVIEALLNQGKSRTVQKAFFSSGFFSKKCSMETALAVKNIWYHKRRYGAIIFSMVLSMTLFLNVYMYLEFHEGRYMLGQDREYEDKRSINIMVKSDDTKKMSAFYEAVAGQKEVDKITWCSSEDFLAFFPLKYISKEVRQGKTLEGGKLPHTVYKEDGSKEEGICASLDIYGLDDLTFQQYLKKAGLDDSGMSGKYPVIVEDATLLRAGGRDQIGGLFSLEKGEELEVQIEKHQNAYFYISSEAQPMSFETFSLQTIGITDAPSPSPSFIPVDSTTEIHAYMRISDFREFMEEPKLLEMQEESAAYAAKEGYMLPSRNGGFLNIELKRPKAEKKRFAGFLDLYAQKEVEERSREDAAFESKVDRLAAQAGLKSFRPDVDPGIHNLTTEEGHNITVTSSPNYGMGADVYAFESMWMWAAESKIAHNPSQYLMGIFKLGLVVLVSLVCLISILNSVATSIRLRRREFPVLQSMGMTRHGIKKMIWLESAIYGLAALIIGIPVSLGVMLLMILSIKTEHYVKIVIPYHILGAEIIIAAVITILSVIYASGQMKHVNIMESIRDENL